MMNAFSLNNVTFNGQVYPNTMALAGAFAGSEWDGKLCILFLDIQDGFVPGVSSGYVAGYFDPTHFLTGANSNRIPMIFMDTFPATPGNSDSIGTLVHEMMHLMEWLTGRVIRGGNQFHTWVSEGLAESAEWVYSRVVSNSRLNWYNNDPNGWIRRGDNFFVWEHGLNEYATVNLFFQWLRLQAHDEGIYRTILTSTHRDFNAVLNAIEGYTDWGSYLNGSWGKLLRTWLAANYIMAPTGRYGYMNDPVLRTIRPRTVPASEGTSIQLLAGEGVYSITSSGFSMPSIGTHIRYAGLGATTVDDNNAIFPGALLTYNINTNTFDQTGEVGTITGIAASVLPISPSVQAQLSEPYAISIWDMLNRNGRGEGLQPPTRRPILDR
jgi:hypothetical protein